MKKAIAILLVLVLAGAGLFAASSGLTGSSDASTIELTTTVAQFASFGVTATDVDEANFKTKALFDSAVNTNITKSVNMLDLVSAVEVGKLSGINNTAAVVSLTITTTALVSGTNSVNLDVLPASATIPAAGSSAFGTLKNTVITVKEATSGAAALAPAGDYVATVTIQLTSV